MIFYTEKTKLKNIWDQSFKEFEAWNWRFGEHPQRDQSYTQWS